MSRKAHLWHLVAHTAITGVLAATSAAALAKVADCPPVQQGTFRYSSHAHAVEAVDTRTHQRLWRTELFPEDERVLNDPALEQDVQMNRACVTRVAAGWVRAIDGLGRQYLLDQATGTIVSR